MESINISFIVPIYNVEKYLVRCIESIIMQKLENIEIILVDDGSPDNCPSICDKYSEKYKFIKTIHKKNEGLGYARNSGLEISKGKYIYFVDSDDYLVPDSIIKLYEKAEEFDLDVCLGGIIEINKFGQIKYCQQDYFGKIFESDDCVNIVLKNMLGTDPKATETYAKTASENAFESTGKRNRSV